jgi:hypothetical protein
MSCLRNALDSLDGLPAPILFDKLKLPLGSIRLDTPPVLAYRRHIHRRSSLPVDLSQSSLLDVESVLGVQTLVALNLVSQLFGTRVDNARLEGDEQGVGFGERVRAGVVQVQEELRGGTVRVERESLCGWRAKLTESSSPSGARKL